VAFHIEMLAQRRFHDVTGATEASGMTRFGFCRRLGAAVTTAAVVPLMGAIEPASTPKLAAAFENLGSVTAASERLGMFTLTDGSAIAVTQFEQLVASWTRAATTLGAVGRAS
jgi:hypothetical protein